MTQALEDVIRTTPGPTEALSKYARALASDLASTDFQAGCPLATAVLEQAASEDVVAAIGDGAFDTWRTIIGNELRRSGAHDPDKLALLCVAAFEGALILARANRDVDPLYATAQILASMIERSA